MSRATSVGSAGAGRRSNTETYRQIPQINAQLICEARPTTVGENFRRWRGEMMTPVPLVLRRKMPHRPDAGTVQ